MLILLGAFASGLVFGSPIRFTTPQNVAVNAFGGDVVEFRTILAVNLGTAAIIVSGVFTGGLLSMVVTALLGNYLGIQTAVLVAARGSLLDMLVVTGPHGVLELAGFTMALAAALIPLAAWVDRVSDPMAPASSPRQQIRESAVRFARTVLLACSLLVIAAVVEVTNALGT